MKKTGITLEEVVVVGVIFIGLVAVLTPSFLRARNVSQQNKCINNLRMIDAGKCQWSLAKAKVDGDSVVTSEINEYIKGSTTPGVLRAEFTLTEV